MIGGHTKWGIARHEVTLTEGFYLGKHEVAQAQWKKVKGTNPSKFSGDSRPGEKVSWTDAMGFCQKLTQLEQAAGAIPSDWAYTLPAEAQWEYACRAGTTTPYAFGKSLTKRNANFTRNVRKTTNVGKYPANAWGFHDMHGNAREWCLDWYGDYPTGPARDPQGPENGSLRVARGGSWLNPPLRRVGVPGKGRTEPTSRLPGLPSRFPPS